MALSIVEATWGGGGGGGLRLIYGGRAPSLRTKSAAAEGGTALAQPTSPERILPDSHG